MKKILLVLACFVLIAQTIVLGAQTGKIKGRIVDSGGEPLFGVNIVVLGTTLGAATDGDGYYIIINVPAGIYELKVSAIGYNSVTIQNVRVSIDLTTEINTTLTEESIQLGQDVVVVAEKPIVQKDLTASTAIVGADLISELPVTEVSDVLQLQAGITVSNGELHMRGGRKGQIAFQIDGVPVTDAYDQSNVINVNADAVQELQVVSGAFNAEFGQAMSGIVNIVTKDGSNNFTGSVQSYVGDYVSNKDDIFWNIGDINPISIQNHEGSLSGPIIKDKLFFYTNARYYYNKGYFYGKDLFSTSDYARAADNTTDEYIFYEKVGPDTYAPFDPATRNAEYISMNPDERYNGQFKLTYRIFPSMKVSYNFLGENQQYKQYDSGNRLTPSNNQQRFRKGYSNTVTINHAISNSSFYNLSASYFFNNYKEYLYKDIYTGDPNNPTEYTNNLQNQTPGYSFAVGGSNHHRFTRSSGTITLKLDWTTQATNNLNIQIGGLFNQRRLYFEDINLQPMYINGAIASPYNVVIPPSTTTNYNQYLRKPYEASAYAQTKFEAFNMIFNAGVRMDVFNPNANVLTDPSDPTITAPIKPGNKFFDYNNNGVQDPGEPSKTVSDRFKYWYKDASIKYQLSPRIGIAFPISDRGVIHFSYGHFFQLPSYDLLYSNPDFELGSGSGNQGLFGNADLKPQKTVKGEIGLQQQLSDDIGIDVTMFFEDFRDLTGTQTESILVYDSRTYSIYSNSDFGFSKGFIVKLQKRFSQGLAVNIDYTYSVTKGNSSNPDDARNAALGGSTTETIIAPLDWDQTHTINLMVAYSVPRNFGISIIGSFYSGQPYTPAVNQYSSITQNGYPRNSDNKPNIFNMDLRVYKDIPIGDNYTVSVFLKVYNLFDMDNPTNVYTNTGSAYFTFDKLNAERINPTLYYNTLDELYTNPTYFSEPRRMEIGASFNF